MLRGGDSKVVLGDKSMKANHEADALTSMVQTPVTPGLSSPRWVRTKAPPAPLVRAVGNRENKLSTFKNKEKRTAIG